jgi:hypothetical protein
MRDTCISQLQTAMDVADQALMTIESSGSLQGEPGNSDASCVVDRVLPVRGFFQCPDVCSFGVAEYIRVAIVRANTKVHRFDSVPLIFNGFDKQQSFADPKLDRTLI